MKNTKEKFLKNYERKEFAWKIGPSNKLFKNSCIGDTKDWNPKQENIIWKKNEYESKESWEERLCVEFKEGQVTRTQFISYSSFSLHYSSGKVYCDPSSDEIEWTLIDNKVKPMGRNLHVISHLWVCVLIDPWNQSHNLMFIKIFFVMRESGGVFWLWLEIALAIVSITLSWALFGHLLRLQNCTRGCFEYLWQRGDVCAASYLPYLQVLCFGMIDISFAWGQAKFIVGDVDQSIFFTHIELKK